MSVLDLLRGARLAGDAAMLPAAGVASLEDTAPGSGAAAAESVTDPALRLVLAAAAEARRPSRGQDWLLGLAGDVPQGELGAALTAAEPYFARVDARWAAELPGKLGIAPPGGYGFDVAARLGGFPADPGGSRERQLRADAVARLATGGEIRDRADARLDPLREITRLYPGEAAAYLVAASCVDLEWTWERTDAVLRRYPPWEVTAALRLVAEAAVAAGRADAVVERFAKADFVAEQAIWFAIACQAGALGGTDAQEWAGRLIPRVADESDDDPLLAGLPIVEGLAHAGFPGHVARAADKLAIPAPLLIDRLFTTGANLAPLDLDPGPPGDHGLSWWPANGTADELQAACDAALAVATAPPWWPLPGTLPDILGWQ